MAKETEPSVNEELCEDCPLRRANIAEAAQKLDETRVRPDDSSDQRLIMTHEYGRVILDALELARPERCEELRGLSRTGILPPMPRQHLRGVIFSECPENNLVNMVLRGFPED